MSDKDLNRILKYFKGRKWKMLRVEYSKLLERFEIEKTFNYKVFNMFENITR
jgi:hypothetical protein